MDPAASRVRGAARPAPLSVWITRGLLVLTALVVFAASFHTLFTPDFWFHLRGGEEVLRGAIPRVDTFSYPSAGRPYLDLHWLYQAGLALGYRLGGSSLTIWIHSVLTLGTFALLYLVVRRRAPAAIAAFVIALAAVLASERFQVRPEAMTFLCFAVALWLRERHREDAPRALWWFPPLFLLWVNVEGLFVLGFLVLAAMLLDRPRDRRLWLATALSLVATLVNPYFLRGALHPFELFTRIDGSKAVYSTTIAEFLAPFAGDMRHPAITLLPAYALALLLACVAAPRRLRRSDLLLLMLTAFLAWKARRNIALFALATAPILAGGLAALAERCRALVAAHSRERTASRSAIVLSALLAVLALVYLHGLVTNRIYISIESNREFGTGLATLAYPVEAVDFLKAHEVKGPIFATMSCGSYQIYHYPAEPAFVDGRLEVHSTEHYASYLAALDGGAAWSALSGRYGFEAILIDPADAPALTRERLADPVWSLVHWDPKALVFVRREGVNAALVATEQIDRSRLLGEHPAIAAGEVLLPSPSWFSLHLGKLRFPWRDVSLGQQLLQVGAPEQAAESFRRAAVAAPQLALPRILLAGALNQARRAPEALAVLQSSGRLRHGPDDRLRSAATRGDILLASGQHPAAVDAYSSYLRRRPRGTEAGVVRVHRGWARLGAGDPAGAAEDVRAGLIEQPGYVEGYRILGQAEEALGRRDSAAQAYRTYVDAGGQAADAREALRRLTGG